jgi:hypothetical protein
MMNIVDIFEAFGGQAKTAALLEVTPQAISNMKKRRSIPSLYWPTLVGKAKELENPAITFETLAELQAQKAAA